MRDEDKTKEELTSELVELRKRNVELEKVEEELAHERDLLQALMDNIPDNIYFKDAKSRFIRINAAQVKSLGAKSPEEVVGKTDFDFFPDGLAREFYASEQRIVETGQPLIGKIDQGIGKDGKFYC